MGKRGRLDSTGTLRTSPSKGGPSLPLPKLTRCCSRPEDCLTPFCSWIHKNTREGGGGASARPALSRGRRNQCWVTGDQVRLQQIPLTKAFRATARPQPPSQLTSLHGQDGDVVPAGRLSIQGLPGQDGSSLGIDIKNLPRVLGGLEGIPGGPEDRAVISCSWPDWAELGRQAGRLGSDLRSPRAAWHWHTPSSSLAQGVPGSFHKPRPSAHLLLCPVLPPLGKAEVGLPGPCPASSPFQECPPAAPPGRSQGRERGHFHLPPPHPPNPHPQKKFNTKEQQLLTSQGQVGGGSAQAAAEEARQAGSLQIGAGVSSWLHCFCCSGANRWAAKTSSEEGQHGGKSCPSPPGAPAGTAGSLHAHPSLVAPSGQGGCVCEALCQSATAIK